MLLLASSFMLVAAAPASANSPRLDRAPGASATSGSSIGPLTRPSVGPRTPEGIATTSYQGTYLTPTPSVPRSAATTGYSVNVGSEPIWSTYDAGNGLVYVPNFDSNTVSILQGTLVVTTVTVGAEPYSAVYDYGNGLVYVLNENGNSVTVFNGTTVAGTVKVGISPQYGAYDASDGLVYVPCDGSNAVYAINGTSVNSTIAVGDYPLNATYDPDDGDVYVDNQLSNTVSVINETHVIATVAVGSEPWSGVYDAWNGWIYTPNGGTDTVSILNGTKLAATVRVGSQPFYGGFDNASGLVYIANFGSSNVSVINGTSVIGNVAVGSEPLGAAWDADDGNVYVANSGADNISAIDGTTLVATYGGGSFAQNIIWASGDDDLYVPNESSDNVTVLASTLFANFTETGLPKGTDWWVTSSDGTTNQSTTSTVSLSLLLGNYTYVVGSANTSWEATGGAFGLTNRSIALAVTFHELAYAVNFTGVGLAPGIGWSVVLDGERMNSTGGSPDSIVFTEINGTFAYSIDPIGGWSTTSYGGSVNVTGGDVFVQVNWTEVTYPVTVREKGLPGGVRWWFNLTGAGARSFPSISGSVAFDAPNGTFDFTVGASNKTYAAPVGEIEVAAGPAMRTIVFALVNYTVTLAETGLPTDTGWSVALGSGLFPTVEPSETTQLENGSYAYAVIGVAGWTTVNFTGTLTVDGAPVTLQIDWTQVTYNVTFEERGVTRSVSWSVDLDGTTQSGTVSFDPNLAANTPVEFLGLANGSYAYSVASIAGYTASPFTGTVRVSGGSVTETITFTPLPTGSTSSGGPTFLGLPASEGAALLGVPVAAVVVAVLLLWTRRRRPSGPGPAEAGEPPGSSLAEPPAEP